MRNLLIFNILLLVVSFSHAQTFNLPKQGNIVGEVQIAKVGIDQSLGQLGRLYDLGVYEMIEANPHLDPWVPTVGATAVIPTKFILPKGEPDEMVINLAEMRIYYFHRDNKQVTTHPIGIGKKGWGTPLGKAKITQKTENPTWTPPESIRKEHLKKGNILPDVVPPGPDNPLGKFAMRLSIPGYLMHGTNRPAGIGVRSSSGCIRFFPEDALTIFAKVRVGTKVRIIHQPYKMGYSGNSYFIEAHQPLSEPIYRKKFNINDLLEEMPFTGNYNFNWKNISKIIEQARGIPVLVQ